MERIVVKVNSACNLECKYCFNREREQYLLQTENQQMKAVEYFLECIEKNENIKNVVITGGEPTLYTNVDELLERFRNKNIILLTNGIKRLQNDNLKNVNIIVSLDGNYEVMQKQRNVFIKDFDKIIDNIIYYIEQAKHVDISTLITKLNLEEKEYYPFEKFGTNCSYSFNIPSKVFTPRDFQIMCEEYDKVYDWVLSKQESNDFRLNASVGIMPTSYVRDNIEQVIDGIYVVEYDMEKNFFSVFNKVYYNIDEVIKNEQKIRNMLQNILRYKIRYYNSKYINPYNEIEEHIYLK